MTKNWTISLISIQFPGSIKFHGSHLQRFEELCPQKGFDPFPERLDNAFWI